MEVFHKGDAMRLRSPVSLLTAVERTALPQSPRPEEAARLEPYLPGCRAPALQACVRPAASCGLHVPDGWRETPAAVGLLIAASAARLGRPRGDHSRRPLQARGRC